MHKPQREPEGCCLIVPKQSKEGLNPSSTAGPRVIIRTRNRTRKPSGLGISAKRDYAMEACYSQSRNKEEQRALRTEDEAASLCSVIQTHDRTAAWSHEDRGGSFSPQTSSWFWSCGWDSKQTHHQTTADLSHTEITTILHAISPDLCPTEPYQLWGLTDDVISFNIFYISMKLCWIVQLQRERDKKGHICKVSQRFGFSSSSKRALQSDLQT